MQVRIQSRSSSRRGSAVAAAGLLAVCLLAPIAERGSAAEIPPSGGFYIQTGGPNAAVGIGDWYSSNAPGAGAGYHYVTIVVPCGWPSATPLHLDLFSPEMNAVAGAAGQGDEPRGNYDSTQFELYGPAATIGPGYDQPAPGSGIAGTQVTYPPGASGVPEAWVRHATLSPAACGTYILRSVVLTAAPGEGDDDNGWRIRVGSDNDADPNNAPPPNSDDADGQPGTNDEIIVGQVQITYQQSVGGPLCLTLYQYVAPGQASATFHNFDMDGNTRVTYYAPSDTYDPTGMTGGTPGTLSSSGQWNLGTIVRGGDALTSPEPGWWRLVSCLSANNQFIQEGQAGVGAYFSQPPTPAMELAKTDGLAVAPAGSDITYTVTATNSSGGTTAGAAHAVVVTDSIPAATTFVECVILPPATGSCGERAGVVTATLDGWINAGEAAEVEITVRVDPDAAGTLTNDADVVFEDVLGNPFPAVTASDVDSVGPPLPTPTPSDTPSRTPSASASASDNSAPTATPSGPGTIPDTSVGRIRDAGSPPAVIGALIVTGLVSLLGLARLSPLRRRRS